MTEPCILIGSKADSSDNVVGVKWDENAVLESLGEVISKQGVQIKQASFTNNSWLLIREEDKRLLSKLQQIGKPLGEYVQGRFYYGIKTPLNEAFVIERATRDKLIAEHPSSAEIIKPFVRGRDVKRWLCQSDDMWLIFTRRGIEIEKYPAILRHLKPLKARLTPGIPGGRKPGSYEWYEIQDNIAYWQEFETSKIVYQDIARYFGMAWDDSGAYLGNTCYFIPTKEKWLLAVLLSSSMQFYVQKALGSDEGGFIRLFSIHVEKFPIPPADAAQKASIERLVEYLLWLHREVLPQEELVGSAGATLLAGYLEQWVNALVYELFFPEPLHAAGLRFFHLAEKANLRPLSEMKRGKELTELRAKLEEIYAPNHPLRQSLFALDSVEEIRIIEGKA